MFLLVVTEDGGKVFIADMVTISDDSVLASFEQRKILVEEANKTNNAIMKIDILILPFEWTIQEGGSGSYRVRMNRSRERAIMIEANVVHSDKYVSLEQACLTFIAQTGMNRSMSG